MSDEPIPLAEMPKYLLSASTLSQKEGFKVIHSFSDTLFETVRVFDFRTLAEAEMNKIRTAVDALDRFIQTRKSVSPKKGKEVFQEAEHKLLALRLGGRIDYQKFATLDKELYKFIKHNKLDKKCFALGVQLSEGVAIPFELDKGVYQELRWQDLHKQAVKGGYRFFYKGQFLMETDRELRLAEEFVFLHRGITFYHPKKAFHITPIDKRDPAQWGRKNLVEIFDDPFLFVRFRKEDGTIYCAGVEDGVLATPASACFEVSQKGHKKEVSLKDLEELLSLLQLQKQNRVKLTEKEFLAKIQKILELQDVPEEMLVTKNKFFAYITLPYALIKFFLKREEYPGFTWKDVIVRPYAVSKVDKRSLREWVMSSS